MYGVQTAVAAYEMSEELYMYAWAFTINIVIDNISNLDILLILSVSHISDFVVASLHLSNNNSWKIKSVLIFFINLRHWKHCNSWTFTS